MAETLNKVFIDVEVDASVAGDAELATKLEEVCPVDIFKATDSGVEIVEENLDECVLCKPLHRSRPRGHRARQEALRRHRAAASAGHALNHEDPPSGSVSLRRELPSSD